jgi:uncharacterized membrane protein YdjX (TVP38/TMEM64 family)
MVLAGLAAAWHWTPLKGWLDIEKITGYAAALRNNPLAPFVLIAVYVIGGLLVFPVTLLVVATAVAFGPWYGFTYSMMGCLASALGSYAAGRLLGRETVQRLVGQKLNGLIHLLAHRGLIAVVTIRLFPIAPYSIINFAAGAFHIRILDYALGTVLGLAPAVCAIAVLGERVGDAIAHPSLKSLGILAGLVAFVVVANLLVRRWLMKNTELGSS